MHAAKALQNAVFAVAHVTPANPFTISSLYGDVTISTQFGRYTVKHAGGEVKFLDRDRAIDLIERCLVN